MLITIENNDERVTIDTATALGRDPGPGPGASGSPADIDAGPARFDATGASAVPLAAAGTGPMGGGVLDGGAYRA